MKRNAFPVILFLVFCAVLLCAGPACARAEDDGADYADAWVNHWEMENRPENTLDITRNGDGTLNMWFQFPDAEDLIFDFEPYDFESVAFGEPGDFINGNLRALFKLITKNFIRTGFRNNRNNINLCRTNARIQEKQYNPKFS